MKTLSFLPMMVALGALAAPFPVSSPARPAYPIPAQQIANAITARGVKVYAAQVELLASVVAALPDPQLDVVTVDRWGERRSKVLLACHAPAQCLPFYVALNWSEKSSAELGQRQWTESPRAAGKKAGSRPNPVIRAGQSATLVIDSGRVHLQLPVICLQSGPLGASVRVASKDRRRIYLAEVLSSDTVKGGIQ